MKVIRSVAEFVAWRAQVPQGRPVGLVPTMGFLHQGHMSLLREARGRVPVGTGPVVLTIFVNPTQFGPDEDLDLYPRDEAGDLNKARSCGVDVVLCPESVEQLYPFGASTWVNVEGLDQHLCGASRPDHFRGVCTVVAKLWNLVQPSVAVFGQKDYQQLAIVRRMHRDLFLCGEVVGMPIVRESDGLALSSRNRNLAAGPRNEALAIPRYLDQVRGRFAAGERNVAALRGDPVAALAPGEIDYVSIVDEASLQPVTVVEGPALCAVAAKFGGVRLIDNTVVRP